MYLLVKPEHWVCNCGARHRFFRFFDGHSRLRRPRSGEGRGDLKTLGDAGINFDMTLFQMLGVINSIV